MLNLLKEKLLDLGFICVCVAFCGGLEIIFLLICIFILILYEQYILIFVFAALYCILGMYLMDNGQKFFGSWDFLQHCQNTLARHWFRGQNELVFTSEESQAEIKGQKKLLIGSHPHGFIPVGICMHGGQHPFFRALKTRQMTHRVLMMWPISSIYYRLSGMESIDKVNMQRIMKHEEEAVLLIVPGGGEEMMWNSPGEHVLWLKKRKGFVKYCLRYGYNLLPIFHFGVTEIFSPRKFTKNLPKDPGVGGGPEKKKSKLVYFVYQIMYLLFSFVFIRGYNMFLFCVPKKKPVYTFVGDVVEVPQVHLDMVSDEIVDKFHTKYVEALLKVRELGIKKMKENPEKYTKVDFGKLKVL